MWAMSSTNIKFFVLLFQRVSLYLLFLFVCFDRRFRVVASIFNLYFSKSLCSDMWQSIPECTKEICERQALKNSTRSIFEYFVPYGNNPCLCAQFNTWKVEVFNPNSFAIFWSEKNRDLTNKKTVHQYSFYSLPS